MFVRNSVRLLRGFLIDIMTWSTMNPSLKTISDLTIYAPKLKTEELDLDF